MKASKFTDAQKAFIIKATLETIAAGHPASQIDDLMPWAFQPPSS